MRNAEFEILMTKYIDGVITDEERQRLDSILDQDPALKETLQQQLELETETKEILTEHIVNRGRSFDAIFEQAWQQQYPPAGVRNLPLYRWVRFATGLAAGLLIGLATHFAISRAPGGMSTLPVSIADNGDAATMIQEPAMRFRRRGRAPVIHNVDWYHLTNQRGDQWLIEGYRDDIAKRAVYYGDL